jgi:Ty3 transposon capsid-like protein
VERHSICIMGSEDTKKVHATEVSRVDPKKEIDDFEKQRQIFGQIPAKPSSKAKKEKLIEWIEKGADLLQLANTKKVNSTEGMDPDDVKSVQKALREDIPKFLGSESCRSFEAFVLRCNEYFHYIKYNDKSKIAFLTARFSGILELWWRMEGSQRNFSTYAQFMAEFRKRFVSAVSGRIALANLHNLVFKSTVTDFVNEFCAALMECPERSESDNVWLFTSKLPKCVREVLWANSDNSRTLAGRVCCSAVMECRQRRKGDGNSRKGLCGKRNSRV